jgi:4-deoxy-L-threo-5-hexosulose-uronate ketol-isomerase
MELHASVFKKIASELPPDDLRREFLAKGLFAAGEARLRYWEVDRTVIGAVCPTGSPIPLPNPSEVRSTHFLERREAGIINIGGPGVIRAGGTEFRMANLDALYLGKGVGDVSFASDSAEAPARFWIQSYPAHVAHPSRHVRFADSLGEKLGGPANANERSLHKLIDPAAFPTCQVVMGITRLAPGSVWNTMPPHTHMLRSEVYLYFGIQPGNVVFHFMGEPQKTRHLVVHDTDAVLSPPWSIHSGAGTSHYSFIWGMGGENQEFADMTRAEPGKLL